MPLFCSKPNVPIAKTGKGTAKSGKLIKPVKPIVDSVIIVTELQTDEYHKTDGITTVTPSQTHCFHCGSRCRQGSFRKGEYAFCCQGCLAVFELLTENGLAGFYALDERAGVCVSVQPSQSKFRYLDEPSVRERIVAFADDHVTRVVLRLPAIHCIACIWLLENLFRLKPGIGRCEANFLRKEVTINFQTDQITLSEVVALLTSLGYEPDLKLSDLGTESPEERDRTPRKLWTQLGVAGFAFGNNMLFSIASYLGLDFFHGAAVQTLVGYISMLLALPVLLYSAQDYFRLAWTGLKQKLLTIEVPIALGILVIFAQSSYEVITGRGEGYFDSFAGLLFFLLSGRLFQQKTYDRLSFDRDFRSFFPLAVTRRSTESDQSVSLSQLKPGDHLLIRNAELIPADARLLKGQGYIDYSFVTGEAVPVEKLEGDYLYAGGRQIGSTIEIETAKEVSQSYLTSLWNQDAFKKPTADSLDSLINRYSQRFTKVIIAIAFGSALFWTLVDSRLALKALTSVLIVACPCALALASPFTMGTAIRLLGQNDIFVKNAQVLERVAQVDSIVFDKTGTLTTAGAVSLQFEGMPLRKEEELWIHSLARHSTHPNAVRITEGTASASMPQKVRSFLEIPSCGIEASVGGHEIALGSAEWLSNRGVVVPQSTAQNGSIVHVAIDKIHRGAFLLANALRRNVEQLIPELSTYTLALLSGDNEKERPAFERLFGHEADLYFNQSPASKLEFVHAQQERGRRVMMVGDGLNDAGALKQSDVGVAVVESIGAFSPASDVILSAGMVPRLGSVLRFSGGAVSIVRLSFLVSTIYNVVGLTIAACGLLSPIVCAILMPLSSISVVAFACASTAWWGRRTGFLINNPLQAPK